MDEIEMKSKKNYDLIINNSINFIKSDLLSKARKIEEMQIEEESSGSSSDSSSDSSNSSSSEDSDSEEKKEKKEKPSKK
jgi:hypothetical protein